MPKRIIPTAFKCLISINIGSDASKKTSYVQASAAYYLSRLFFAYDFRCQPTVILNSLAASQPYSEPRKPKASPSQVYYSLNKQFEELAAYINKALPRSGLFLVHPSSADIRTE